MDIFDLSVAVFIGNALTASFAWGFIQFQKHDESARWIAYAATLFPIIFALATLWSIGLAPHQFDALISQ